MLKDVIQGRKELDLLFSWWQAYIRGTPWSITTYWFPSRKNMVDRNDCEKSENYRVQKILEKAPFTEDFLLVKQGFESTITDAYIDVEEAYWDGVEKSCKALKR